MGTLTPSLLWQFSLRVAVGAYWLFFSSQRWFDVSWARDLLTVAAEQNYLPVYGDALRILVVPNWLFAAIAVTVVESTIGILLLLGILTKIAAGLGAFNALNLTLTFSFCRCPWVEADFPLVFWFYFSALLLNVQVIFDSSSRLLGVSRLFGRVGRRSRWFSQAYVSRERSTSGGGERVVAV